MSEITPPTGPTGPTFNEPKKPSDQSGCVVTILKILAVMLATYAVVGYIIGFFGYEFKDLGEIDLSMMLILLVVAFIFGAVGFGLDAIIRKKKKNEE